MKKKILVAEDDADDQKFLYDFLQFRNDIDLLPIAENGVALVAQLEQLAPVELPDLIILDQNMPKRNGIQTLKLLKEDQRFHHLPVIIYSTYTDEELIKNAAAMGACHVVAKPASREGYDRMMNEVFKICI